MTQEGFLRLKQELQEIKNVKRKEITARIESAKELGDLSENAEYQTAKDDQALNEGRIMELEEIINRAVVIQARGGNEIALGSRVTVQSEKNAHKEFVIVGATEANPQLGLISNESPLGRVLLGRQAGDEVQVITPAGTMNYQILAIG